MPTELINSFEVGQLGKGGDFRKNVTQRLPLSRPSHKPSSRRGSAPLEACESPLLPADSSSGKYVTSVLDGPGGQLSRDQLAADKWRSRFRCGAGGGSQI